MDCKQCGGSMSASMKNIRGQQKRVFECNQDNGECLNERGYPNSFISKYAANGNGGNARGGSNGFKGRGGTDADTVRRITRAHAQEMALRYATLKGMTSITPDALRSLISWFQNDVATGGKAKAKPAPEPEPEPEPEPQPDDDEIPY